jgi:hypothetical protein
LKINFSNIQLHTYLNVIEEEMCISKVEHHLLHPEAQLYHRVGILDRDKQQFKNTCSSSFATSYPEPDKYNPHPPTLFFLYSF